MEIVNIKQSQLDILINTLNHSVTDLKIKVKYITWIQGYQATIITGVTVGLLIKFLGA